MNFDLLSVTLEGPDCAGKTTLYNLIHKGSGFRWNIQDRGTLSMLCYALFYGRTAAVSRWRRILDTELHDLNRVIVAIQPTLDVILERLRSRGDEYQDERSIVSLYKIFSQEIDAIRDYPNVLVCDETTQPDDIVSWLNRRESKSYSEIAASVRDLVSASKTHEIVQLKALWSDTDFTSLERAALLYPKEVEYYDTTRQKFLQKIEDELAGRNEYSRVETAVSRRFVMTQDTCISYFHALVRDGRIICTVVLRSSEVRHTFPNDINFIAQLGILFRDKVGCNSDTPVEYDLTLDSAHIIV